MLVTFKELMAYPGPEEETDDEAYMRYRSQKRRRNVIGGTIGGPVGEAYDPASGQHSPNVGMGYTGKHTILKDRPHKAHKHIFQFTEEDEEVDEALNTAQRLQRSRSLKKNKAKIKLGRDRAMRKTADKERLMRRARKAARMALFKKLSKGESPSAVPYARRAEIEKRLDKMKAKIERMATKLLPQVRKKELERKRPKDDQ